MYAYAFRYIFSETTIVKPGQNFPMLLKKTEFTELPFRLCNKSFRFQENVVSERNWLGTDLGRVELNS